MDVVVSQTEVDGRYIQLHGDCQAALLLFTTRPTLEECTAWFVGTDQVTR